MSTRNLIIGLALVLIGLAFLSRTFGVWYFSAGEFFKILLSILLVVAGFWLIARKKKTEEVRVSSEHDTAPAAPPPIRPLQDEGTEPAGSTGSEWTSQKQSTEAPTMSGPGKLKYNKALGDMFIDFDGMDLQSVEISAFIGDIETKLSGGKLATGLNRMVVSGFIGDIRILVPTGMPVLAQASSFIGDVEIFGRRTSGFGNNISGQTQDYEQAESKLYVAVNSFIGDVRIYEV
ncbi:MAG: cell wall-active antibiotics response protein [Candidatus Zixiibacteriota bacterium]|nr:MAG: cell wall-active antibiotics response protein [candidate division Zixibacteria bacterium]